MNNKKELLKEEIKKTLSEYLGDYFTIAEVEVNEDECSFSAWVTFEYKGKPIKQYPMYFLKENIDDMQLVLEDTAKNMINWAENQI